MNTDFFANFAARHGKTIQRGHVQGQPRRRSTQASARLLQYRRAPQIDKVNTVTHTLYSIFSSRGRHCSLSLPTCTILCRARVSALAINLIIADQKTGLPHDQHLDLVAQTPVLPLPELSLRRSTAHSATFLPPTSIFHHCLLLRRGICFRARVKKPPSFGGLIVGIKRWSRTHYKKHRPGNSARKSLSHIV